MAERFIRIKGIRCCPECGRGLEPHPLAGNKLSCYPHGDLVLELINGEWIGKWQPLTSKLSTTSDPTK